MWRILTPLLILIIVCAVSIILLSKYREKEAFYQFEKTKLTKFNTHSYLINMKRNPERLVRFMDQYKGSDLATTELTRIEGVDGKMLELNDYVTEKAKMDILNAERLGYRTMHYQLTRGAVGCYLSHLETYRSILTRNEEFAIIFEDDAKLLRPDMLASINIAIQAVPNDWDILLLGCVCFVCGKYNAYYDVNRFFLLHGYIIKRTSAAKIVRVLETEKIEQQIDAKFSDMAEEGSLKIYCLRNKLAVQYNMGTTIQTPVKSLNGVNPFDPLES
jgi:GR25 family glycosyltransferase involved in LPS biosynthesis